MFLLLVEVEVEVKEQDFFSLDSVITWLLNNQIERGSQLRVHLSDEP